MADILKLYTQYSSRPDRRQQNVPVSFERRSGMDRRSFSRLTVDPKLRKDIENTFKAFNISPDRKDKPNIETELAAGVLSSVPYYRRFTGVLDSFKTHDYFKAASKAGILFINIPEDSRDISKAMQEFKGIKSGIPNSYQTPFSFFRGTFLDKILKKLIESDNERLQRIGDWLFNEADITLDKTRPGRKIIELIGGKKITFIKTSRADIYGKLIKAKKVEGSLLAEFTGKTFMRIPVITMGLFMIFEIPAIVKAFTIKNNKSSRIKNGFKQIVKSFINVNILILSGAVLGAAGSYAGATGSLIGLGAGSYLGSKAGNIIDIEIEKA